MYKIPEVLVALAVEPERWEEAYLYTLGTVAAVVPDLQKNYCYASL
jgi:hypothetical protein